VTKSLRISVVYTVHQSLNPLVARSTDELLVRYDEHQSLEGGWKPPDVHLDIA